MGEMEMQTYHKIQTVFNRDPETGFKTLLEGQWAKPEFDWLKDLNWRWAEKIDGTNIRVMFDGEEVWFNGKTDNAQTPGDLIRHLYETFTLDKMKAQFGEEPGQSVCLYGEGFGAGIQKGGGYRNDKSFILFDALISGFWLDEENVADIAIGLGCLLAPIVGSGPLRDAVEFARTGYKSKVAIGDVAAEGLIMRPPTTLFNRRGERVIAKIKYRDFGAAKAA